MTGPERRNARSCGRFVQAAEGTRTLDLLHGKQYVTSRPKALICGWITRFALRTTTPADPVFSARLGAIPPSIRQVPP